MRPKYETLDLGISFRAKTIEKHVKQIWKAFFERVPEVGYDVDRAVWICNRFPAWIGVKPGTAIDDESEEPAFVVSAVVSDLDELRDEMRLQLDRSEFRKKMESVYLEYHMWLVSAIRDAYAAKDIQKRKAATINGKFGVYATAIDDLHTSALDEMEWVAGDKL